MDLMFCTFSPTEHDGCVSDGYVRTIGMYWPWLRPDLWHVPGFSLRLQPDTVTYCQLSTTAEVLQYWHHRHIVSTLVSRAIPYKKEFLRPRHVTHETAEIFLKSMWKSLPIYEIVGVEKKKVFVWMEDKCIFFSFMCSVRGLLAGI